MCERFAGLQKMSNLAALVLAAGESKRMAGRHKLLLPLAGKTMIAWTVEAILAAGLDDVIVVLGHEAAAVQKTLNKKPVRFAVNPNYRRGMASSIQAGLAALAPQTQIIMIALADQPLVTAAEINFMIAEFSRVPEKTIGVPTFNGQRGHPVLLDLRYREEMLALQGDVGCKSILARYPEAVFEIAMPAPNILEDADTPEAYARLSALLK